jgi:hypothetical protein
MTRKVPAGQDPLISLRDLPQLQEALAVAVLAVDQLGDVETLRRIEGILDLSAREDHFLLSGTSFFSFDPASVSNASTSFRMLLMSVEVTAAVWIAFRAEVRSDLSAQLQEPNCPRSVGTDASKKSWIACRHLTSNRRVALMDNATGLAKRFPATLS